MYIPTPILLLFPLLITFTQQRDIPLYDSSVVISLQQTSALYPLAIDSKNFSALSDVFAKDIVANYSAPIGALIGVEAIMGALETHFVTVTSQHLLGTFAVTELDLGNAKSITYFTASQFGTGGNYGQVLHSYGQFVDDWVVEDGYWKISRRQLNYMGPNIGNFSVFPWPSTWWPT